MAEGLTDRQISGCFNRRMGRRYQVRLVGGAAEPFYSPGSARRPAIIRYTRDYAASALHELAHWCIAGHERRRLPDYGYWYQPPPRTEGQQQAFYRVELPVQALEARLAAAAGVPFRVSVDDLDRNCTAATIESARSFEREVLALAEQMTGQSLSARAAELEAQLANHRLRVLAEHPQTAARAAA